MARREVLVNDAVTTLNGAINGVVTSLTVTDGSAFPSDMDFRIIIDDEIMKVTQVATNTLTVERGVEGTSAAAHSDTADVAAIVTAQSLINVIDQSNDFMPSSLHPAKILDASGDVMTSSDFTWFQQGTSTITDESNGNLTLITPTNSVSHQWRGMMIDPGSTPWTIETFIQVNFGYLSGSSGLFWGTFMHETSSGKLMTLHNKQFNVGACSDWTDSSTFSATNKSFDNGYDRTWFKLEDDGTNLTFSVGVDGRDYFEVLNEARGTFFDTAPNRVGFCMNPYDLDGPDQESMMHVISWIQS